jgi:membrane associated rhomboid family serine protease
VFPLKDNIPTRRFPILTVAIIVINVVMFFGFQEARWDGGGFAVNDENVVEYAEIPYEITHPGKECGLAATSTGEDTVACEGQEGVSGEAPDQPPTWLTLLTSMFMHGGLLHIGGNMLFLWIFGNNVEDAMGRPRFVLFYLAGGLVATFAQVAFDPSSTTPTLGASGAVAAVLGAYAVLYPRARVVTLIFIIFFITIFELPALLVLGFWFLEQAIAASATDVAGGGGVAYWAHIGGFVFGLAAIKLFANRVHEDYDRPQQAAIY